MKMSLITLFTGLTMTLFAQVPNWNQYTCEGDQYSMYTEFSKGKAVVLHFSSLWSAGSIVGAQDAESLWQNMMLENVKVFGFIHQDQDFNVADCDDLNQWESAQGTSYPSFVNIENVLNEYVSKYTLSGATTLPWFLLFFPNDENLENSTLAYSGHDINALNHILYDQWVQGAVIAEQTIVSKKIVRILDMLGRETAFKANTMQVYVYSDGSTKKIFSTVE